MLLGFTVSNFQCRYTFLTSVISAKHTMHIWHLAKFEQQPLFEWLNATVLDHRDALYSSLENRRYIWAEMSGGVFGE